MTINEAKDKQAMAISTSKAPKIKWKVGYDDKLRGQAWPNAEYADGSIAAWIVCDTWYTPSKVKSGDHGPLTIRVADYSETPWKWKQLTKRAATLAEAKALFSAFLAENHEKFSKPTIISADAAKKVIDALKDANETELANACVAPTATGTDSSFEADVATVKQAMSEAKTSRAREGSKKANVIELMKRPEGATAAQIAEATGWQTHTIRSFISIAKKNGTAIEVVGTNTDGNRIYHIAA